MKNAEKNEVIVESKPDQHKGSNIGLYIMVFGGLALFVGIVIQAYIDHH